MSDPKKCDCARKYGKTVELLGERLERKDNRIVRLQTKVKKLQKALDYYM